MDLITDLPTTEGFESIFTIIDRFSKYVIFIFCKATFTACDLARLFYEQIFCKFGMPKKIVTGIVGFCPSSGRPSYASYSVPWQCQVVITLRQMVSQSTFIILLNRYSITI